MKGVIEDFPEVFTGLSETPAAKNLFEVRPDKCGIFLDEERAQSLHYVIVKLLFSSSRSRKDIQTVVAFLTTIVKSPGEDDWGKVKRVLRYIRSTKTCY
jgi:hypothetical protein